jgi:lipopolysaccharide transport system ATP-binding protein
MSSPTIPTVFHVTHWKAGSQWIHRILRELVPERIVAPLPGRRQFLEQPILPSAVYPTVYVTREQFFSVPLPQHHRRFFVLRDLRDTLVSGYYSIRYSHPMHDERMAKWRAHLEGCSLEAGLEMLLREWLPASAAVQKSWVESGEAFLRYEELLERDLEIMTDILLERCQLDVAPERLREVIVANRFEHASGGRMRGEENVAAHERKAVPGDWKQHFSRRILEHFNDRYGGLVALTGYGE